MSTASGKPTDLAAYLLDRMRDHAVTERNFVEDCDHPPLSPYAPKRAHERASTKPLPVENDHDPLQSPYGPKKARTQPAANPDFAVGADAAAPPVCVPEGARVQPSVQCHALPGAQQHGIDVDGVGLCPDGATGGARGPGWLSSERDGPDHSQKTAFEDDTRGHSVDPDTTTLQSALTANKGRHEQSAPERDESDRDLEQLEASLGWLQRQEAAARLRRATALAPVPGLPSVDARGRQSSERVDDDDLGAPLSLKPEAGRPPKCSRRGNLRGPLRILAASIFAAPIVYYFSGGHWDFRSEPAPGQHIASFDERNISSPGMSVNQQQPWPIRGQDNDPERSAFGEISSQQTKTSQTARIPEGATLAMLPPSVTEAEAPPENKAVRALDPDELKLLTKQGEQFALAGDLATARTLFQRAAEAGDAAAAMALGTTYDPIVLKELRVVGLGADVEKARGWYRVAESQGSVEARQRLHALANR